MYHVINCRYISILCNRYIHMYSKGTTNVKIILFIYFIISFYKLRFFITMCYTQNQWLWAVFDFLQLHLMFDLQSVVSLHNNKWWNHVCQTIYSFKYISSLFFLVDLLSHFKLLVFVVQLKQGSCLYVISNEQLSVCLVLRVCHCNLNLL